MVVTRRAPAPPIPTSRTNSAQAIPRVKGKALQIAPDVSSPLANETPIEDMSSDARTVQGHDDAGSPSKKGRGKWKDKYKKEKEKHKRGGTSFMEFLTRIFLLWFAVYTLSVCPNDDSLNSPICRGLHAYRRYILEPYLLPPVQRALAHPSIVPYIERAKPIIQTGIDTAKPVALRVQSEWSRRVVPQWKKRIVPQWQKRVAPQLDKHVWPHTTRVWDQVAPYIATAQVEYETKVGPSVHLATHKLYQWQHQARPYVVLAAHKTYDSYQKAKPYAVPVLQRIQLLLLQLVRLLGEQRRQFVDPHVQKIWERVKELSNGEHKAAADVAQSFADHVSEVSATATLSFTDTAASEAVWGSVSSILPDLIPEIESLPASVPLTKAAKTLKDYAPIDASDSSAQSVLSVFSSAVQETMSSAASAAPTEVVSVTSSLSSSGSVVILDNVVPTASMIIQDAVVPSVTSVTAEIGASVSQDNDAASSILSQVPASVVDVIPEVLSSFGALTDKITSTANSAVPPSEPTHPSDETDLEDDLDLENFYAELGLNDIQDLMQDETLVSEPGAPPDPVDEQAQEAARAEERRRRMEQTAKKRADITSRHTKWETELEDRIVRARKELRKLLVASRKTAVAELKESESIRKEVDGLVEEAEKYLKGAEKYMGNLRRESRTDDEKRNIWDRVVEKVDQKFAERLAQTETVVNSWYMQVIEQELQEVRRLTAELKDIAGRAQADIGLDYAWLDDVTVADWQRYHDLERRVENFTALATSIQDGTHPSPPINPILPALEDLQNEVQDVVVGFETRLRRIKRNGERAFGAAPDGSDANDVPSDETVSILPIQDGIHKDTEGESPSAPPVLIGRSKEEILSALDRVAEREGHATDDKHVDGQRVVANLAQEAIDESNLSPPSAVSHEEL